MKEASIAANTTPAASRPRLRPAYQPTVYRACEWSLMIRSQRQPTIATTAQRSGPAAPRIPRMQNARLTITNGTPIGAVALVNWSPCTSTGRWWIFAARVAITAPDTAIVAPAATKSCGRLRDLSVSAAFGPSHGPHAAPSRIGNPACQQTNMYGAIDTATSSGG